MMNNGLAGPTTTDTVTGGKTLDLTDYDQERVPHNPITDDTEIRMNTRMLSTELSCPICLDLLTSTMTTKECLHRFCAECITTALMRGNKECPTCRKKIVSKRSLRPDPNFDSLISKIWPDRKLYEEMQSDALKRFQERNNVEALQKSIEAGMKAQAVNRRQRIQGSYDYEKRKRRPKTNGADAPTSVSGEGNPEGQPDEAGMEGTPRRRNASGTSDSDGSSTSGNEGSSGEGSTSDGEKSTATSMTSDLSTARSAEEHIKPPALAVTLKDKMNKWLNQNPSSPLVPSDDVMESSSADTLLDEMRRRGEEIEVELVPAKSLIARETTVPQLLTIRYIKAPVDVTMEHLGEFLLQAAREAHAAETETMAVAENSPITRPEYFYVLDQNDQVRKIFLHETLYSAFLASTITDEHLIIFYDTVAPDINCQTLVAEIVSDDFLNTTGSSEKMEVTSAENAKDENVADTSMS